MGNLFKNLNIDVNSKQLNGFLSYFKYNTSKQTNFDHLLNAIYE